jgi:hypothetical protein
MGGTKNATTQPPSDTGTWRANSETGLTEGRSLFNVCPKTKTEFIYRFLSTLGGRYQFLFWNFEHLSVI